MTSVYVSLTSAADVQVFVGCLTKLDGQFDFVENDFILDAKSIMGVLALDRSKPLRLDVQNNSQYVLDALMPFVVKEPH